jgi:hypothetical protein
MKRGNQQSMNRPLRLSGGHIPAVNGGRWPAYYFEQAAAPFTSPLKPSAEPSRQFIE